MIQIDYSQIENNYAAMSELEFSKLRRFELTSQAALIYDRELARRSPELAKQMRDRDADDERIHAIDDPNDPEPQLGLFTICVVGLGFLWLLAAAVLFSRGESPGSPGALLSLLFPLAVFRWNRYWRNRQAWQDRRKQRDTAMRPDANTPLAGGVFPEISVGYSDKS
jgi:hypothetical protein